MHFRKYNKAGLKEESVFLKNGEPIKIKTMKSLLTLVFAIFCTLLSAQKFEGLAMTPPMGWNSWNTFQTDIDEQLIKDIADAFVEKGLQKAGYRYIVIDDGWMARERDSLGYLVPDPVKFPNGLKTVVDYVHSRGLKFGIYNCAGWKTCAGYPGSRGYEFQDARTYASWGVDYLKYDWCNTDRLHAGGAYLTMRNALYTAGRPIVFSICEWGDNQPWEWGKEIGHLWRTTGDISPCWDCEDDHGSWSSWGVMRIVEMREGIRQYAGPGHWNDPDMMEVGNGMTENEDRAHFSLWCMLAAPLIMGNDLRNASVQTLQTLSNEEAIAIDQDPLGIQGFRYSADDSLEVWLKPLRGDDSAVCFLNRNDTPYSLSFDWKDHSIFDELTGRVLNKETTYQIRDVWKKANTGTTGKKLKAEIMPHDVLMVRLARE